MSKYLCSLHKVQLEIGSNPRLKLPVSIVYSLCDYRDALKNAKLFTSPR